MIGITITNDDLTPDGKLKKQYPDISGHFMCYHTNITSLVGSPVKVGFFNCYGSKLTSLIGAPMIVNEDFYGSNIPITSLQGIGRDYLREIGATLFLNECSYLKSHMLGIMLVKKLKIVALDKNLEVEEIFNRHISGDRDLLNCKEELMNNGFKELAKL